MNEKLFQLPPEKQQHIINAAYKVFSVNVDTATDLFQMMDRTMQARYSLMLKSPYICAFALKAYYEQTPEIKAFVQSAFHEHNEEKALVSMNKMDMSKLRPDIDVQVMYQEIELACEGYLYSMYRASEIDARQMESDFKVLISHWKKVYERSGE